MICSRRGFWVSAIVFGLLLAAGSPSGAEAASAMAKGKKSVSTAKPELKALANVRIKGCRGVEESKAVAALKKNAVKKPKSNNGTPPYKDPVVTPVVGPVDGGGSAGGGAVPEPAVWMGLAGCAAVMLAASRWRGRPSAARSCRVA